MIIDPCCIDNQLPKLMQSKSSGCFYSNGDWGAEKLIWATAWMVEGSAMTVLLMQSVDVYFLRYLRQCLQRGWTSAIALATKDDCTELVEKELKGYQDCVLYAHRENICTQGYYRHGIGGCMAVCGRLDEPRLFCQYFYVLGSWSRYTDVLSPIVPQFAIAARGKKYCQDIMNFLGRNYDGKS